MWTKEDEAFMQHALDVAERGRGRVAPNPLVGCVLVKEGEIIAEGWHDHLGGLHAEQMAIHDAEAKGKSPNGATAYVTLEPCNHYGRTPPCTEALLWSGVQHVIVAHPDPNPTVRGKGFQVLRDAGITVESGLLEQQAAEQMKPFLHWCEHRRPIVTVKLAVDANGSVDDRSEAPQRFTSEACLDEVHRFGWIVMRSSLVQKRSSETIHLSPFDASRLNVNHFASFSTHKNGPIRMLPCIPMVMKQCKSEQITTDCFHFSTD